MVKNILVVVDHFTRYVQAFVTKNHTAHTTARVLYNNFFSVFSFPQKLLSEESVQESATKEANRQKGFTTGGSEPWSCVWKTVS